MPLPGTVEILPSYQMRELPPPTFQLPRTATFRMSAHVLPSHSIAFPQFSRASLFVRYVQEKPPKQAFDAASEGDTADAMSDTSHSQSSRHSQHSLGSRQSSKAGDAKTPAIILSRLSRTPNATPVKPPTSSLLLSLTTPSASGLVNESRAANVSVRLPRRKPSRLQRKPAGDTIITTPDTTLDDSHALLLGARDTSTADE